jgi:transcriptional regulator with XRE-family HTH domain
MDLKTARLQANLTQEELGRRSGLTPVAICRLELGQSMPRPSTRSKIEKVLGPVDWPTEGKPLTAYETHRMFEAIKLAATRIGSAKAIDLFYGQPPERQRDLMRAIHDDRLSKMLLPPDVDKGDE